MANAAIHPGEHIQEELEALQMSAPELAQRLDLPAAELIGLIKGERQLTADMAMRLAHFFGMSAQFWLGLQSLYDLRMAEQRSGDAIKTLPTLKDLQAA